MDFTELASKTADIYLQFFIFNKQLISSYTLPKATQGIMK